MFDMSHLQTLCITATNIYHRFGVAGSFDMEATKIIQKNKKVS